MAIKRDRDDLRSISIGSWANLGKCTRGLLAA